MEPSIATSPLVLASDTLSDREVFILKLTNNITTALSLLGIAYFFILSYKLKSKSFIFKLIKNLMLSDLTYSLSNVLMNFDNNPTICTIEGFMRQYSQLTTLFWATSLAYSAFIQTIYNIIHVETRYWFMKVLGFGLPLIVSLVPFLHFSTLAYGKMGTYCWILQNGNAEMPFWLSIVLLLGYIWAAIILVTYWYARIYFFISRVTQRVISTRKLFVYPIILLVSFLPITADHFLMRTSLVFISAMVHMVTQHLNGFLNAITYGIQTAMNLRKANRVYEESLRTSLKSVDKVIQGLNSSTRNQDNNYEEGDDIDGSMTSSVKEELLRVSEDCCD